jgi:uncharacterized membrane protein
MSTQFESPTNAQVNRAMASYSDWDEEEQGGGLSGRLQHFKSTVSERVSEIDESTLSQTLAWVSFGIGAAELLAPKALGRAIGVGDRPTVMRLLGAREIVTGIGLLSGKAPGLWAWARVAGDVMDLALLGAAARSPGADTKRIAAAASSVLGVAALDVYASRRLSESNAIESPVIEIVESLSINASPEEIYSYWKNFENLPSFMRHLESVTVVDENMSHWIAKAPLGTSVEWDAHLVVDEPNRRLGWETSDDSSIQHEGLVSFEETANGKGTIVRVEMSYEPPAGHVGATLARLLGEEPRVQIHEDLRRLKQLIETGEIPTTLGQPSGRRSLLGRATLGGRMQ